MTVGNLTAPGKRDFGCPADYDAIDMVAYAEVVEVVEAELGAEEPAAQAEQATT